MKWSARLLGMLLISTVLIFGTSSYQAADSEPTITILFTHDLHDNLLPFKLEKNGGINYYGGFARLQTAIKRQREKDNELLLVDGGDFSMGTLFQTIFRQEAPGLRLMGQMGYDVATLGNHEFDFRPDGLAASLNAAKASHERLPQLAAGNISFPADSKGKLTAPLAQLKNAMQFYGVKEYTVLERKGYKIGVFGVMGKDSASNAPMAGVEFTDAVERARSIVKTLEAKEKVDLIVCLSHSGTGIEQDESEDVILAKKVPQIDVVISGHSHTKLDKPIVAGGTVICSGGEYGQNLGKITLKEKSTGEWETQDYRLISINDGIPEDAAVNQTINKFKSMVQKSYLDNLHMDFDDILAHTSFSFTPVAQIADQHAEQPLANLISDAYIYAVQQAEGPDYEPVDVAVVPNGTIRASFVKGDITVSDAFNASSLGIGPDKKSGYPLISIYLTGKELKTACEVDASITPLMRPAQLYMSGVSYTFNPHRLIFNKVTETALQNPDGSTAEIEDTRLYRVVAGLYSAQMLSVVGDKSLGLLSIVPKTKEGVPITDFEGQIIRDVADGTNNEVKEWIALAQYLRSFAQVDGVAQVPAFYSQKQGRKNVDDRATIGAIMTKPNSLALTVYGIIILILLLILLVVRFIIRRRKKESYPPFAAN